MKQSTRAVLCATAVLVAACQDGSSPVQPAPDPSQNSAVQSVLMKDSFKPADLVECIRRLVRRVPADIGTEAAS